MLEVRVNKLTSTKTLLPYSYYSLPYCRPEKIVEATENLGEILSVDLIKNSAYEVLHCFRLFLLCSKFGNLKNVINPFLLQFKMREPQRCNILCHQILDAKTAKDLKEKIDDEYRVNM